MKLAILFSGGKDSCSAAYLAQQYGHDVVCLLAITSKNPESYMFHTPNISRVDEQAAAMDIPLLLQKTAGEKESELTDLHTLIEKAKAEFDVEGIVTGAIKSIYQATRIQKICHALDLTCFNPLWQRDEAQHVQWLLKHEFVMHISAIAAYPLEASWLGRELDAQCLHELCALQKQFGVSPAGEGGEFETIVTHAPGWKYGLTITQATKQYENHAGIWHIEDIEHTPKKMLPIPLAQTLREILNEQDDRKSDSVKNAAQTLIISTCKDALHELEFVLPIARIARSANIVHHTKVTQAQRDAATHIIICGTALADNAFVEHDEHNAWIRTCDKPLLGICAGFQLIARAFGSTILPGSDIGMVDEHYFMHQSTITPPKGFTFNEGPLLHTIQKDDITAVLFHPEVRNEKIITTFLEN